jgi:hypothetical protein
MTPTFILSRMCAHLRNALAALVLALCFQPLSSGDVPPKDTRIERLESFFRAHHCPAPHFTGEYLAAADNYSIDYRLLPAVSVRESTCGLHARLNNRWGWDSARTGFDSVARGIHYVMRQLAWARPYKGKTMEEKLRTYNPTPRYAGEVLKLMREIGSDEVSSDAADSESNP